MIKYDHSKLSVEIVRLKSVTTAMGGSISIIDETRSGEKKEVMTRIIVPMSVARSFIMASRKITKYLKPIYVAVIRYQNNVVALEGHPLGGFGLLESEQLDGTMKRWEPTSQYNIDHSLRDKTSVGGYEWYFDGRYVYTFPNSQTEAEAVRNGDHLSADGKFRKVNVEAIDLQTIGNRNETVTLAPRTCLAFLTSNGAHAISPPIWKDLSDVGMTQFKKEAKASEDAPLVEDKNAMRHNFDRIDESMSVNLNFILHAGREIGTTFGYEYVEPLQLPRLMVELHTVNLPTIPHQIKSTYDSGIKFSHAVAWLLGLTRRANTLETHIMMRSLMKYLTKRGLFRNNVFNAEQVFKDAKTITDVPKKDLTVLLQDQDFTKMSLSAIMQQARDGAKARRDHTFVQNVAGLLND